MKPVLLLVALAVIVLSTACIIESTRTPVSATPTSPPPTATAGAATTTSAPVSTPTPRVVSVGGRTIKQYAQPPQLTIDATETYTATIKTNLGDITLDLFVLEAPRTVNNFVFLAREGFYDNTTFHRVMKDFMIQGGDPLGTGFGGPGYRFADEPVTRRYTRGILAMGNSGPDTNGSQFFIVHGADAGLPPQYTIFGQVIEGIDTVDKLANTPVTASARRHGELSVPTQPLVIQSVTITES